MNPSNPFGTPAPYDVRSDVNGLKAALLVFAAFLVTISVLVQLAAPLWLLVILAVFFTGAMVVAYAVASVMTAFLADDIEGDRMRERTTSHDQPSGEFFSERFMHSGSPGTKLPPSPRHDFLRRP